MPPLVAVIIGQQSLKCGEVPAFDGSDEPLLGATDLALRLEPPPKREGRNQDKQSNPNAEFFKKFHE